MFKMQNRVLNVTGEEMDSSSAVMQANYSDWFLFYSFWGIYPIGTAFQNLFPNP